ncbi:hypothetical protein [Flavobacterium sp.]|jgi:hypothetical protein|uniref:hypothetical protein n=1 Tax=Flavobacterium sp. TaxID=239 RepID=UPI0037C0930C
MKLDNKTLIYVYAGVLFILTFLFVQRLITSFKTQEFDYLRLSVNLALLIYIIIKVVKLGKVENNSKENNEQK